MNARLSRSHRDGDDDYNQYNHRVNAAAAERLLEINRRFYSERGGDFSETRLRIQPGVRRLLQDLRGDETILDLGCGNGGLARELSQRRHRGRYVGVDLSIPLLEHARRGRYDFPVSFIQADLIRLSDAAYQLPADVAVTGAWSLIAAFAVLHHIPGTHHRLNLLKWVRGWLGEGGSFLHSHWQFSSSPRMQNRIQPWAEVDLQIDVDERDFLVDWRRGGRAYRYVHEFTQAELTQLAADSGFTVSETFRSDGADGRSGLYQIWRPA